MQLLAPVLATRCLLIAFVMTNGCTRRSPPDALLATWRSPVATAEERAEAVNRLIAPGTKASRVEGLLGAGGVWERVHGPLFDLRHGHSDTSQVTINASSLNYRFGEKTVALSFTRTTGLPQEELGFCHAMVLPATPRRESSVQRANGPL